ncbi:hypothetical protein BKA62DRAFT_771420 [Auriculariales sp. MPI-PUGE-AT-0066]|nr:hypothetical protein BKA62DRAFT_771420 [Auriculariales sp. MPI-PUGE-AT-0066]
MLRVAFLGAGSRYARPASSFGSLLLRRSLRVPRNVIPQRKSASAPAWPVRVGGRDDRQGHITVEPSEKEQQKGKYVVGGILAVCGVVFVGWKWAEQNYKEMRDGSGLWLMLRNFTSSSVNWREGRWWTLITPVFSHKDFPHILFNSIALWSFAPEVCAILGVRRFLLFFTAAGIAGNAASVAYHANWRFPVSSYGASGAALACVTLLACMVPSLRIGLFFIPMPAWAALGAVGAFDVYNSVSGKRIMGIDSIGHLAGNFAGLVGFVLLKRLRLR